MLDLTMYLLNIVGVMLAIVAAPLLFIAGVGFLLIPFIALGFVIEQLTEEDG